jgi:hypothetical protein
MHIPARCARALFLAVFILVTCLALGTVAKSVYVPGDAVEHSKLTVWVSSLALKLTFPVLNPTQETEISECPPIQRLSALKAKIEEQQSPIMRQVFAWLFPFGPAWNSGMRVSFSKG